MKLLIKKEPIFKLFWLLLLIVFFAIPFKSFGFIKSFSYDEGTSLFLLFLHYLKAAFHGDYGIIFPLLTLLYYSLLMLMLLVAAYLIVKITDRTNKIMFLKNIDNFIDKMLSIRQIYILLFILLISFIMRLVYMSDGLLHHDSIQTALATEKTVETGKLYGISENKYGFILINAIAYIIPYFLFDAQSSEMTINIVTILFAALSSVMIYLFTGEFFKNNYLSFSSAMLFSLNPVFFSLTTFTKEHAHSIFFVLLAAFFLVRYIKVGSRKYSILFSLSLGFSLFIRFSDVVVSLPFFFGLYLFAQNFFDGKTLSSNRRFSIRNILTILTPFLFIFILFLIFQWDLIAQGMVSNRFLGYGANQLSLFLEFMKLMTPLGLFLFVYGMFYGVKTDRYLSFLLLIWFLSILIFYSSFGASKLRFFVPLVIPVSVFAGMSLNYLKRYYVISPAILIITLVSMFLFAQPAVSYRHEYSSGKEWALKVDSLAEKNALIIDYGDLSGFYDYYTDRKIMVCPDINTLDEALKAINNALENNNAVYFSGFCLSLARGEDEARFHNLLKTLTDNFDFTYGGKAAFDNYENFLKASPQEFNIYKLIKK